MKGQPNSPRPPPSALFYAFHAFNSLWECGGNRAEDIYRTKRWIVLIMERLEGGELFEQIAAWSWNNFWVGREGGWSAGRGMVEVMVSNTNLHNWEIDQQLALDSD